MKTKVIIAIATLAIVFGLYGLAGRLQSTTPKQVTAVVQETTFKVWFVVRDVQVGEALKRRDLQVKEVSEGAANRLGVTADVDLKFVKGAVYNRALAAQKTIFSEDITSPQDIDFIDLMIAQNRIPFAIKVNSREIIGGLVNYGSYVDILALTSAADKLTANIGEAFSRGLKSIAIAPVLMGIKVLQVQHPNAAMNIAEVNLGVVEKSADINLILELTSKQVTKLIIARRIAQLEVHKSIAHSKASDLTANAGDVLADYKAIKEFRADKMTIN